jgi:epoxyqueuosine reductase
MGCDVLELTQFCNSLGVSLPGAARVRPLPQVPESFSPRSVLPEADSVICYGVPIPKGVVYGRSSPLDSYWRYCNMAYRLLDAASSRLCVLLEEKGELAAPLYGCFPWKIAGGGYRGLVPLVYWAEEAGLGRLTRSGLLASPVHGTRLLLGGVVTTMKMEHSNRISGHPCPDGCRACLDSCPVSAIAENGQVDHNLCIRRSGANPLLQHLLRDRDSKEKFSLETLFNTVAVDDHGAYTCFACVEACPLNR